eukprot:TRINITY_DN1040_c0_g1_i1.p1 TRINITY_DN1040_c0_g1~~TRINITY_DN1040_c0_g1_i1.p1  ORF type:complete len:150 (+),score=34.53 TRINITY_DN1040_c0_g1_i1:45-494(+)
MSCDSLDWKFSQVFGDSPSKTPIEVTDVDIVSAIEFDSTGDFIAAGDRGGRVVVFKQNENKKYKFYAEFQSHEPEFDYLKSLEIEEKINKIKWRKTHSDSLFLLTANGTKEKPLVYIYPCRLVQFTRLTGAYSPSLLLLLFRAMHNVGC